MNAILKPKVFVAMSGGVDSSVAAALLKKSGKYDIVGVFCRGWQPEGMVCGWKEERRDALRAAAEIGVPFLTFNFSKEYEKKVVEYMKHEYAAGRTPNPDVMCNKYIKFGLFLEKALEMGADMIATGHYVKISNLKSLPADATHQALQAGQISKIKFPVLALIVSGGHTELVLIKDWLKYKILGQTLDDAAGEAFDKVAKMLNLGYPGGPVIGAMADKKSKYDTKFATAQFIASLNKIKLPRPMLNSKDYNFSFSGLKTAVLYLLKDLEKKIPQLCDSKDAVNEICAEFQQAVIDVLIVKTVRAVKEYKAKTIILGGGVAGNRELRRQLKKAGEEINFGNRTLLMPEMEFTGDNAAMIALAAYFRALKNPAKNSAANKKIGMISKITADSNLRLK